MMMNSAKIAPVVFCIVADTDGAHEADCVYSIWTTAELAQTELARINQAQPIGGGCYGGRFHVVTVALDHQSDMWIQPDDPESYDSQDQNGDDDDE